MIKLTNVTKKYGNLVVLNGLDLLIENGEKVILTGNSGQGKTTLLRIIAKLEDINEGIAEVDADRISFAIQDNLLLENLTAYDNIAYGIDQRTISKQDLKVKVDDMSHLFECDSFLYQKTNTLSGGQKQRVALARAFIKNPTLVLIDEAFNSLDQELKESLLKKIIKKQEKEQFTLIYISHDDRDIEWIGGRVIVLENGKIKAKEV